MGPDDLLLIVMLSALTVYALLGGADFGAGVWEFITVLRASDKERQHIYKAIGPVWEANHVWLIFVLVILMNGFPLAFAALSRALWLPLLMALCGIVFRGASFAFRSYGQESYRERKLWEAVFAIASTATPLFLGASAGAVASGKLARGRLSERLVVAPSSLQWLLHDRIVRISGRRVFVSRSGSGKRHGVGGALASTITIDRHRDGGRGARWADLGLAGSSVADRGLRGARMAADHLVDWLWHWFAHRSLAI